MAKPTTTKAPEARVTLLARPLFLLSVNTAPRGENAGVTKSFRSMPVVRRSTVRTK